MLDSMEVLRLEYRQKQISLMLQQVDAEREMLLTQLRTVKAVLVANGEIPEPQRLAP